jgi:phosphoribosylformylglycinamidine synthase
MKARVYVTLKTEVLDPQGEAVRRALQSLGFDNVQKVRVGKLIEIELAEPSGPSAGPAPAGVHGVHGVTDSAGQLKAMCEKLLANPIVEDFSFELDKRT